MENVAIVLAGGKGTRMKRKTKVCELLCGKPIIKHIVDALLNKCDRIIIVISPDSPVREILGERFEYVVQNVALGTGHALKLACEHLGSINANVLIINGDGPFVSSDTLDEMLNLNNCAMKILTRNIKTENFFGRIIRDKKGAICGVREYKDCTSNEKKITEVNLGLYSVEYSFLLHNIAKIKRNNAKNEYYATDLINLIYKDGGEICGVNANKVYAGVNTLNELNAVENEMENDILSSLANAGVRFIGNSFVDCESEILEHTTINPFCVINKSKLDKNVTLFPQVFLEFCKIGESTKIYHNTSLNNVIVGANTLILENCILKNCIIGDNVVIKEKCMLKNCTIKGETVVESGSYFENRKIN